MSAQPVLFDQRDLFTLRKMELFFNGLMARPGMSPVYRMMCSFGAGVCGQLADVVTMQME